MKISKIITAVLAIGGSLILVVVGLDMLNQYNIEEQKRDNIKEAERQVRSFRGMMGFFRLDVGRFPTSDEGLAALYSAPENLARWRGPYLLGSFDPTDPWGNDIIYRISPSVEKNSLEVISMGPDGLLGVGEDNDDLIFIDKLCPENGLAVSDCLKTYRGAG